MSLFKHSYSGLITGGLGMKACCGLLTFGFSLFKCKIEVLPPPPVFTGGGGGGFVSGRGGAVPLTRPLVHTERLVVVTVKIGHTDWKKTYTVSIKKADIIVRVVNLLNTAKDKVSVGVNAVKRASKHITAVFKRDDK